MELRERYLCDTIVERNLSRRANPRQLCKIQQWTGENVGDIPSLSKLISMNHVVSELCREFATTTHASRK